MSVHLHRERPARARPVRVPAVRDVQTGEILMTLRIAGVDRRIPAGRAAVREAAGPVHRQRDGRSPDLAAARRRARSRRLIYRLSGVDPAAEMGWKKYAIALLLFNALGALAVYALQRLQLWLPLNPQQFANVSPDSSFNTAVSFVTNTNWQGYSGESTMSYLTQMAGLAVQNFLSAATGIVVAVALIRGFARHSAKTIGNFWVDVTRCHAVHPAAALDGARAVCSSARAWCRTSAPTRT